MVPETGIIILNYGTYEQTIRNADILIAHNPFVLVVIVDNCSPDNDYEKMNAYYAGNEHVAVLESGGNGGYSKGNNFGIKKMLEKYPDIEYIGIMNPDVRCEEDGMVEKLTGILNGGIPEHGTYCPAHARAQ